MDFRWARDYGEYFYIGLMFPSSIAAGLILGYFIDRWFHVDPWGKLIGAFLGVIAGTWSFIKDYQRLSRRKSNESKKT